MVLLVQSRSRALHRRAVRTQWFAVVCGWSFGFLIPRTHPLGTCVGCNGELVFVLTKTRMSEALAPAKPAGDWWHMLGSATSKVSEF